MGNCLRKIRKESLGNQDLFFTVHKDRHQIAGAFSYLKCAVSTDELPVLSSKANPSTYIPDCTPAHLVKDINLLFSPFSPKIFDFLLLTDKHAIVSLSLKNKTKKTPQKPDVHWAPEVQLPPKGWRTSLFPYKRDPKSICLMRISWDWGRSRINALRRKSSIQIARGPNVITFITGFCPRLGSISRIPTALGAWRVFRIASWQTRRALPRTHGKNIITSRRIALLNMAV